MTTRPLGDDDVAAMVDLVALTEPGPFRPRTIDLGGYIGIFHDDELVAMAGQRLRPPATARSARCARTRMPGGAATPRSSRSASPRRSPSAARHPFLHVADTNTSARAVYELLGFTTRRMVSFGAYRVPSRPD